jgi:site-specific recombinase XerD
MVAISLSEMAKKMLEDSESQSTKLFAVTVEQTMNRYLKDIAAHVGLSKKLTTHIGRHTFGFLFIAAGGQIEVLQKIMGHADLKTTQIYTHIDRSQIQEGMAKIDTLLATFLE